MYSIEAICDAMITAGSAAAACRTEEEFLLCALQPAGDLLDVGCTVFYGMVAPPSQPLGTVRVNQRAASDLEVPKSLPPAFTDYLRQQDRHMIVSADWEGLGTLLPEFDFAGSSSLWLMVASQEGVFGVLAFFDHASRRFDRTQQKIAGLISSVVATGLEAHAGRAAIHSAETASFHEFSKLAGGVARDLINPLTALFGYAELLKAESLGDRPLHLIARMEEQIEKARKVIGGFTSGSRWQPSTSSPESSAAAAAPAAQPAANAEHVPVFRESQIGTTAGARVLLVQRSEAVLEFQRSVLNALGVEVVPAFSASEALDHLRTLQLDAVVLDDELEDPLSSKRVVCWVRENRPELADRMLLTVSRKPSQETREILETAMLPHVTKPIEVLELYSRTQQVLQAGRTAPSVQ